jgi:hypothetical protein
MCELQDRLHLESRERIVLHGGRALPCRHRSSHDGAARTHHAIQAALPKAKLSDTDLANVDELRAKAFASLTDARKHAGKYHEAELATREAVRIVGLVWVPRQGPTRGCGGTYRLKGETDAP